ncbi:Rid family detoxifying hydrolase [Helicobacter sp. 13S00477-4]|uniref:RidA family protein n=1 Tax=Helicobacter sp. 13S00477-4 TaxID=1905759 RepID=UPI000BA666F1|nr:Rid family detoxifying hydrolase [Helicobacter sp. 13S00477-4]PAF52743.1 deaminase [Helicobacter sp. 13S00477-4]
MVEILTLKAPQAIGPYSQGIVHDGLGLIYTSGQIALEANGNFLIGDIKSQTKQVLENLKFILEAGKSSIQKVLKTTVFLTNMDYFDDFNEVYFNFFKEHKPARSTVAVKALPKNALVEIECIAFI